MNHVDSGSHTPLGPPGLGRWNPGPVLPCAVGQETRVSLVLDEREGRSLEKLSCSLKPTRRSLPCHLPSYHQGIQKLCLTLQGKNSGHKIQIYLHKNLGDPGTLPTHNVSPTIGSPKRNNVQEKNKVRLTLVLARPVTLNPNIENASEGAWATGGISFSHIS